MSKSNRKMDMTDARRPGYEKRHKYYEVKEWYGLWLANNGPTIRISIALVLLIEWIRASSDDSLS